MRSQSFIANLLITLGILLAFYSVYLEGHYANVLPKEPKQSEGRTYLLNVHGTVVYLTSSEDSQLKYIGLGSLACGICGGLLWKKFNRHN